MELASPADVSLAHHAILPTKAVFSINFSSAAKGPFIASKIPIILRRLQCSFSKMRGPQKEKLYIL